LETGTIRGLKKLFFDDGGDPSLREKRTKNPDCYRSRGEEHEAEVLWLAWVRGKTRQDWEPKGDVAGKGQRAHEVRTAPISGSPVARPKPGR